MPYLANFVYLLGILLASPWLIYQAVVHGKYRRGWAAKLWGRVPHRVGTLRCVWVHAVSVGEVALADVLIRGMRPRWPDLKFVITATSRTGYELALAKFPDDLVSYAPFDFSWAVRNALSRLRPDCVVLVELELWPNLVWASRRAGIPVAIVNGRLSASSARGYRRIGWLIASVLRCCRVIGTSNPTYADRFRELGAKPESVTVTGSLKYDGAEFHRGNPRTVELARLAGLTDEETVFLAGSTQAPEEQLALEAFVALADRFPKLRLLLVPRHPERFDEVAGLLDRSDLSWQRRSHHSGSSPASARVLLIDTVGELSAWWGVAHIAFVGGSMASRGGQNMIEPAAFGAAISFGPNTRNFRDISQMLLDGNAAQVVATGQELNDFVQRCLTAPDEATAMGRRASTLVGQHRGALNRTIELMAPFLDRTDTNRVNTLGGPHHSRSRGVRENIS